MSTYRRLAAFTLAFATVAATGCQDHTRLLEPEMNALAVQARRGPGAGTNPAAPTTSPCRPS